MAGFKGEIVKMEDWGPRKLSYPIRKNSRGRYFLVDYLTEAPALVRELERTLRLNDGVLKFLTVKTSDQRRTRTDPGAKEAAPGCTRPSALEERPAPVESRTRRPRRTGQNRGRRRREMKPPMKRKRTFQRRKVCVFCADSGMKIDYKDVKTLNHFITERGKILPRRISGNCAKHQRDINLAIKRARNIALMPFSVIGS